MRKEHIRTWLIMFVLVHAVGCGSEAGVAEDLVLGDAPSGDSKGSDDLLPDGEQGDEEALDQGSELLPGSAWHGCTGVAQWSVEGEEYDAHYGESRLGMSPDGALVALQSSMSRTLFSAATGATVEQSHDARPSGTEGAWTLDASIEEENVVLWRRADGERVGTMPMPAATNEALVWLSNAAVAQSKDSTMVAAVGCWRVPGEEVQELVAGVWRTGDLELVRSFDLGGTCGEWQFTDMAHVEFAGSLVLVRVAGTGLVHVLDMAQGHHYQSDLGDGWQAIDAVGDEVVGYVPLLSPVVRIATSPDASTLAAVLHDGRLRFYKLPDLEPTGPTIQAGFAGTNMASYGPSMASPIAWSPDGQLVAHMDPHGQASVSSAITGEALASFPNPPSVLALAGQEPLNPPTAMLFPDGDQRLVVAYESGRVLWSCPAP